MEERNQWEQRVLKLKRRMEKRALEGWGSFEDRKGMDERMTMLNHWNLLLNALSSMEEVMSLLSRALWDDLRGTRMRRKDEESEVVCWEERRSYTVGKWDELC